MDLIKEEYNVSLEVFEGPLDLLLYLIKKDEVDIYDIPIERITTQYMQYLGLMKQLDLNVAGDFIVMSSTLMLIKSRMLLPVEQQGVGAEDEEEDPRWDLVRQLVEYKKFKDVAEHLAELEISQENIFARGGDQMALGAPPEMALHDVGVFDLLTALNEALGRLPNEGTHEIFAEEFTVDQKVAYLLEALVSMNLVSVSALFDGMRSRQEVVCTFLAMLELTRQHKALIQQKKAFGEISISARDAATCDIPDGANNGG